MGGAAGDGNEGSTDEAMRARRGRALVVEVAGRLARQLGGAVPASDLESAGNFALVTLLRAHDPKGAPLDAYLRRFLRWAMLDAVRKQRLSAVPRARARGLEACLWAGVETLDEPEPDAPARSPMEALDEALAVRAAALVLASVAAVVLTDVAEDSSRGPEQQVRRARDRRAVHEALESLQEPGCREVLVRHYFQDEPFDGIARSLGLTSTQLCRLHRRGLATLARALRHRGLETRVG